MWNIREEKPGCNKLIGIKQFSYNASDIGRDALELHLIQASKINIRIKYVINKLKMSKYE